jgi:hypothetical protein
MRASLPALVGWAQLTRAPSHRQTDFTSYRDPSIFANMRSKRSADVGRMRRVHPHAWLWEPLATEPSFVVRPMFGTRAVYLDGKLALCFSAQAEPWRGMLLCTDHIHHRSLMAEFPALKPHSILPKWLYLPEAADAFEAVAERLVRCVRFRDARIGVLPKPRKPVAKKSSRGPKPLESSKIAKPRSKRPQ